MILVKEPVKTHDAEVGWQPYRTDQELRDLFQHEFHSHIVVKT